jgi:hypothetical protein
MKKLTSLFLVLILILPPQAVFAWSEGGHHIIALMAFDLLSKDEQSKLVAVLEKHPRYIEDFAAPEKLPNDTEVLRWKIGRAGYWPDVARKQPVYNRSTWHYELGPALILGDASKLKVPERPGMLPASANLETQELHIAQALELCKRTMSNEDSAAADRAIALCWIAHLVGDAHQPCHAGSLYMENVFLEEDGDRGANRILTKQKKNMHALWDQLLGDEFTLNGTRKRIVEISGDADLVAKGRFAISTNGGLDPQNWLAESRAAAIKSVYSPEVIDSLSLVSRGMTDKPVPIELSEVYLKNAGRVAQERAIEAAYRLAETWRLSLR